MTPFRSKGGKVWKIRVYGSDGASHVRSTETRDKAEARAIQRAHDALRERADGRKLLDAVIARRFPLDEMRHAYEAGAVAELLARLDEINLEPLVETFYAALRGKVADDTREHYRSGVRTLLVEGEPFPRSRFTMPVLQEWIDGMEDVSDATRRKRGMGMRRFAGYLVQKTLLTANPMDGVELPSQGEPRCHYLEPDEAARLADAQEEPYRTFSALLAGTGLDVTTALELRRRDVDVPHRELRAAGTKTATRDRVVRVADWAWPYLERALKGLLPDARIFEGIPDRWAARDAHARAAELLGEAAPIFRGYWQRDARHTYAVRAVRAGTPLELVARQLGHTSTQMVSRVYGKFAPTQRERDHWEQIATARDTARREGR